MQDGFKDKDIEFALYVLQYTENKEDDEIQVWLKEKEHRDLLEELRRFREAGCGRLKNWTWMRITSGNCWNGEQFYGKGNVISDVY